MDIEQQKKSEVLDYLRKNVFNPILYSPNASINLKKGIRLTESRMINLSSQKIVQYYWTAISGTDRSIKFAEDMKKEGFIRFEELTKDFKQKFNDEWLKK